MGQSDALGRGREAFARRDWRAAHTELCAADESATLEPADVTRLATAAYLIGRDTDAINCWRRAHNALIDRGELEPAARCGFWIGFCLLLRGEVSQSSGWLARTQRLLDDRQLECAERGYLLVLVGLMAMGRGDASAACAEFSQAAKVADRFGDTDLASLSLLGHGQALIADRRTSEGVAHLDEAMVGVLADEVSPVLAGIIYCAVILTCQRIFDLRRAHEWTNALHDWCGAQTDLVAFRGQCLVHRSEILQREGELQSALEEAERACEQLLDPPQRSAGRAFYQRGEIHRERGDFERAEEMYREAARIGMEPQPGMALLRLAQGDLEAAEASIRRVVDEASDTQGPGGGIPRAGVLGPYVEIMLAAGDLASARAAAEELGAIAADTEAPYLHAVSAEATGAVRLADGDARSALAELRRAWTFWQRLEAPYESARVRAQIARACRALGDDDTARMHFDAARTVFERLGAAPAKQRLDTATSDGPHAPPATLTGREIEVLGLVASGKTNRQIASDLAISEHTVARHLSNIFNKIGVSSRTAAGAYAFQHGLL